MSVPFIPATNLKQQSMIGRVWGTASRSHMTLEPHVHLILRNEYNVKDLPYVLPLVILEAGNTLGEQKSEKFCWTRQS